MIVYHYGESKTAIDEKRISAVIMHDTEPDERSYIFLNGDPNPCTVDRPFEKVLDDLRNLGIRV